MIILPNIEAIGPGFNWNRELTYKQRRWWRWYEQIDYRDVFPANPTTSNGLALLGPAPPPNPKELEQNIGRPGQRDYPDLQIIPIHKLASDFIRHATISEAPIFSAQSETQSEWLADAMPSIFAAIRRATRYWSVHDLAVLTAEQDADGNPVVRAVDPISYVRIGQREQRDALVGHALIYPYRDPYGPEEDKVGVNETPNAVMVVKFMPGGENWVEHYEYSGTQIGRQKSRERSSIQAICVAGAGESWYDGSQDTAARIMIMLSLIHRAISRYENRTRYIPAEVASQIHDVIATAERGAGREPPMDFRSITEMLEATANPVIAVGSGDVPPESPRDDLMLDYYFEAARTNLDLFWLLGGLTPSSFGIGVGRGESGVAREKAQDAAVSRARAYRRDLAECLPELCAGAGMPMVEGSNVSFGWTSSPFENQQSRTENLVMLHREGIITREDARSWLGFTDMDNPDDAPAEEATDEMSEMGG